MPRSKPAQSPGWMLICTMMVSLFIILTSLVGYALFHHHILTWDEWSFYDRRLYPFEQTPFSDLSFWLRIWGSRYGHRLFFPGLLQKANALWFHADLVNLVVLTVAVQIAAAWLLCR